MPDAFPQRTQETWICRQMALGEAGAAEVRRHVMSLYANGLRAYYLALARSGAGAEHRPEPDDVVNGFFANRLARDDFLRRWPESGLRLRRWLINAFNYYLKEHGRAERRARGTEPPPELPQEREMAAEHVIDREYARALVNEALQCAEESCRADGLEEHWQMFELRHLQELAPRHFIDRFDVDSVQAGGRIRVAAHRFAEALRDLIRRECASESEVDTVLQDLREILGSA